MMDLADLTARQRVSLWLESREGLVSEASAARFLDEVVLALRYGPSAALPLASMYRATQRHVPVPEDERTAHARAFALTNSLLGSGSAIELSVVADRLVLAHPRVVPWIYRLRRDNRYPDDLSALSDGARRAFELIALSTGASSGDVRRHLGFSGQHRPDAADVALTELQRELLIDRGPSTVPGQGIFYLSKEGYPYRVFAEAHPDLVAEAASTTREDAAARLLTSYLQAALFAPIPKLGKLFGQLLSRQEIDDAIGRLVSDGTAERIRLQRLDLVVTKGEHRTS